MLCSRGLLPCRSLLTLPPLTSVLMPVSRRRSFPFTHRHVVTLQEPAPTTKMAIGCSLQGLAWLVMALGSRIAGPETASKMPVCTPLLFAFLLTCGQLYLAPVGLAFVSGSCSRVNNLLAVFLFLGLSFSGLFFDFLWLLNCDVEVEYVK